MGKGELIEISVKKKRPLKARTMENKLNKGGDKCKGHRSHKPKYGPMPTFPNQRFFTRGVLVVASFVIVYFTSSSHKETMLAKQKEVIESRGQNVECSPEYMEDLNLFSKCMPAKCGRFVSDQLVTEDETVKLLDIGKRGLAQGYALGGATILDLHSGAVTRGKKFINIYRINNTELYSDEDFHTYRLVRTKIQHAIAQQFNVNPDTMYLTHPTFFSCLTEKDPVSAHDEYWHPHVDKDTYESFHYTSLLYLSNYGSEFKGGRFIFYEPDNSTVVVEPKKGRVSMFTSGKENMHYIERIISGTRYALTVSFTCDKKYAIKDPALIHATKKKGFN